MFNYVIRRILLVIPTLLVISLLAFGLNQCTPGDPVVEKMPDIRNGNPLEVANAYDKIYKRIARDLQLDQPIFYFNFSSKAYPDTLIRITPKSHRDNLNRMIGQYGNWPVIQRYYQQLQLSIKEILRLSDQYSSNGLINVRKRLQQLTIVSDPKATNAILDSIQHQLTRDSTLQATLKPQVAALNESHEQLSLASNNYEKYIPVFSWNGFNNQYHSWLSRILKGDLGESKNTGQKVTVRMMNALRWTLQLNGIAILLAFLLSIPLGVYGAIWAGSRFDKWLNILLVVLYAMPSFWVATMLSKFLTVPEWIDLFPVMGVGEVPPDASWWQTIGIRAHHLFLPVFCMTYVHLAFISRQVRSSMLNALASDYVRTARAKGISERSVIWKHAFRNAMFPIITMFAGILPMLVGGSIIIEVIFGIPGIGWLTIDAILSKDWSIVYALLLLAAIMTIVGILISDLLYAWADPRVKFSSKQIAKGGA